MHYYFSVGDKTIENLQIFDKDGFLLLLSLQWPH